MKKITFTVLMLISFGVRAQKNILLESAFWQAKPDVAAVKAEIDKGSNPSAFNSNSFDPVVLAINAGAADETVKFLLNQPGNEVTKRTHDGRIYLHWAASKGNVPLVTYLIEKGSSTTLKDSHGSSPLIFTASAGQLDTQLYELLIAKGANPKTDLNTAGANALLLSIASDKNLKLTDYFVSKGLSINSKDSQGNNAFSYAARGGNIELLQNLIKKGVAIDPYAMIAAAEGTRRNTVGLEVYKYLASLGIKPTQLGKDGRNALHALVRKPDQLEIINYFLAAGTDVNQEDNEGNTVIMSAAATNRDTATLAVLSPRVKDLNLQNKKGMTALMLAVNSNTADVVKYLIDKGADPKLNDLNGNNLAFYLMQSYTPAPSAQANFEAKLKLFQAKGVTVITPQKDGNTLFHLAAGKNDLALVKHIEKLGIDINAKNNDGLTALHKAAMVAKDDVMMKYLIAAGAKTDLKTTFDETAFDLANENESLKGKIGIEFLK